MRNFIVKLLIKFKILRRCEIKTNYLGNDYLITFNNEDGWLGCYVQVDEKGPYKALVSFCVFTGMQSTEGYVTNQTKES